MFTQLKDEIVAKSGKGQLGDLKAVSFKTQCVAGTNYFVKVFS